MTSSPQDTASGTQRTTSLTTQPPPPETDETYTVSTTVSTTVIDTTNPRLASIERFNPSSATTDSQTLVYMMTFDEDVTGVSTDDFVMSSDSTGGVSNSERSGNGNDADSGQFTQTRSPSSPITDNQSTSDTITVPDSGTATSVSVAVNISHTYKGDLKVDLAAPDGTTKTLHNRSGGGANNIVQTYTPDFDGLEVQGGWTLKIRDNANGDTGTLNSWTLTVNYGGGTTTTTINPVTSISGSGNVYYATVPASQDGTYNLDLVSSGHSIADTASNQLTNTSTTGADETYTVSTTVIDNTNPRLASIERYNPASQNTDSSSLVYKAIFNESVTGVGASDFVLSLVGSNAGTGSITGISGSGSVYYVTVSAVQDGTYNLDLVSSGHGIRDAANNLLDNTTPTTGTDHTYTVSTIPADATAPTLASIERYNPAAENTDSQTLVYKVTFSENVTGVDTSDFTLSTGSTGTGSGQFTQTRTPAITIPYNQIVTDTVLVTGSSTATSISVAVNITHPYIDDLKVDLIAPDGAVQTLHDHSIGPANINQTYAPDFGSVSIAGNWTLQMHDRYSADDGILNSWTLTINYDTTTTTVSPVAGISGSSDTYYVTVSSTVDGTYNLDLMENSGIKDSADNPLTNTAATGTDQTYIVTTN